MHERDDREPRSLAHNYVRHCAKRETVDERDCFVGNLRKGVGSMLQGSCSGAGKARVKLDRIDAPTLPPKSFRDASVVNVTAGARVERTGCDERDRGHSYDALSTLASKDADATCDSWSVTRMCSSAVAPGPSWPRPIDATRRTKTSRTRM